MLEADQIQKIDAILAGAEEEGRRTLFEFEVYGILSALELTVPRFRFIRNPEEVDEAMIGEFGEKIVLKVVSEEIAHKQKMGGIEITDNGNPLFIRFLLEQMEKRIFENFPEDEKPSVHGFLLAEFIPFKPALGYEILIGVKQDLAFGPILTLSKGGDDAEFFAEYYDPANLFAPPFEYGDALEVLQSLKIRHRYAEIGHLEYLEYIADAASKLSKLAYVYSFIADEKRAFIISSLDINPFVLTANSRFVAVDGYAEFAKSDESRIEMPPLRTENLTSFFNPSGIAVIGVSGDVNKGSIGVEIAKLLHDLGREDIYFVNIKGGSVTLDGKEYPLYKKISDVPEPVELIVYTAPAPFSVEFFRNLPENTYKSVILISGIPANLDYGDYVEQLDHSVPKGLRIIGPNCVGIISAPSGEDRGVNTFFVDQRRLQVEHSEFSNTVLLTQSGGFAISEIDRLQNSRLFHALVSFGNKYDVKITDLMAYFEEKEDIEVVALYVEGFDPGEGRRFFQLAREMKKPVIIYKSGRTETGARAAATHTASMSGDYEVFTAMCSQAGVIFTDDIEDHYDYIKAFSLLCGRKPKGNRVGGVVNSGFEATVAGDEISGLVQAKFSPETERRLQEINSSGLVNIQSSFLDITPMSDDNDYADYIEAFLKDDDIDCVFVAVIPHVSILKTDPETARDSDSLGNHLVRLYKRYDKPMVVSVNAGSYYSEFVGLMEENGLPVYDDIRSAVRALETFVSYYV